MKDFSPFFTIVLSPQIRSFCFQTVYDAGKFSMAFLDGSNI